MSLSLGSTAINAEFPANDSGAPIQVRTRSMTKTRSSCESGRLEPGAPQSLISTARTRGAAEDDQEAGQDPVQIDVTESLTIEEGYGPRAPPTPVLVVPHAPTPSLTRINLHR